MAHKIVLLLLIILGFSLSSCIPFWSSECSIGLSTPDLEDKVSIDELTVEISFRRWIYEDGVCIDFTLENKINNAILWNTTKSYFEVNDQQFAVNDNLVYPKKWRGKNSEIVIEKLQKTPVVEMVFPYKRRFIPLRKITPDIMKQLVDTLDNSILHLEFYVPDTGKNLNVDVKFTTKY